DPRGVALAGLRMAFFTDNGILTPDADTVAVVRAAARALVEAGLRVTEARPPDIERTAGLLSGLWRAHLRFTPPTLLKRYRTHGPHPVLRPALGPASAPLAAEMTRWHHAWGEFRNALLGFMEGYDVVLCPVCAFPAIPHGTSDDPDKYDGFSYTKTWNLTGWPAAVV